MNDGNTKQQIVEKIKNSDNILVTVSANPSVDELSAALGLTLLLNKMKKHATAVFSGAIPPAITFLDPEKTFEDTVDSLRDFIIALDKEKADHLRYKVEGDMVRIFITPFKTTISNEDLEFSQGDYNVQLVLALGVKHQDNLDKALEAHGRILHDATVATISVGEGKSELGSLEWREQNASSLSEMLVGLNEALKNDKQMLDEQIATAFLTGIVAATDRFSNSKTSSRVMTLAAQLMGAGANQQLIASKLEEAHEIGAQAPAAEQPAESAISPEASPDGFTNLAEDQTTKVDKNTDTHQVDVPAVPTPEKEVGGLTISHEMSGTLDEVARQTAADQQAEAALAAEATLAEQLSSVAPVAAANTPSVADLQKDLAEASADVDAASEQPVIEALPAPMSGAVSREVWKSSEQEPAMGGTLNATAEQAADDKRREEETDRNRTILTHGAGEYVGANAPSSFQSPMNAAAQVVDEPPLVDVFQSSGPSFAPEEDTAPTAYAPTIEPLGGTLDQIDKQNRAPHDDARAAVDAAFNSVPALGFEETPLSVAAAAPAPVFEPAMPSLPPLPPLPDFSTLPPLPTDPGFNTAPAVSLPPENMDQLFPPAEVPASQPTDPGQFKIPGQF